MRTWRLLLGGMLVWAAHFFGAYAIASIFPARVAIARVLAAVLTAACLAALVWLTRRSIAAGRCESDDFSRWVAWLATLLNALSFVAVLWQAFPILLVRG